MEYFELLIWLPGRGPLRDVVKGTSLMDAITVARAQYKGARIEIPPPAATAKLAKSDNYNRPTPQRRRLIRND